MMSLKFARALFCFLLLALFSETLPAQGYDWIVPNKAYLKLSVIEDAMYRITRSDFTNAGINTSTIDPRTVRVFNKGLQIPVHFEGENDGVFDNADYFDFFGTRTYGGPTKYYTHENILTYSKDEYYTLYSDTNVYWVEWGIANGIRYAGSSYTTTTLYQPDYYYDKLQFERDRIYSLGERYDGNDFRNFSNDNFLGEGWYWTQMTTNQFVTDTFSVKTLTSQPVNAYVKLFAYPFNRSLSINNEHSIQVQVNGTYLPQIYTNDFKRIDTLQSFSSSLLNGASVNTVRVFYFSNAGFAGSMLFDHFQIQVPKAFRFNANMISANLGNSDTASRQFRISGYVSANQTNIYDVVNNVRITNYTSVADTLVFTAKSNARLEAVNRTITKKPFRIIQRQVPNLASASNEADYIIVYHSLFSQQVDQLQNHRETYDNFRVVKAEIRDIYDIFNYGIEHPVAVRNFLKHAYDNWVQPRVKYAVLFGRATTDPKKNSAATIYSQNLVPTYGNPTTDSYFGNFNYGSFFYYPKVIIGRLPALNATEGAAMVENVTGNEVLQPQSWWKVNTFIVGGGTSTDQQTFQALDTAIINNYALPPPLSQDVHKIFRNDTTTTVTFNYKDSIRRDINSGCAIVNFLGHAGYENWEDGMQDPATLANYGKLPFVMSMTCYTGKNADPDKRTFGEQFVSMLNRGAVGFIGCTGWGWTLSQTELQTGMYYGIRTEGLRRFGELLNRGKQELIQDSSSSTVRHTVNSYGLLGDPASKLIIPVTPEYSISSSDYRLSNTFPEINKQLTITLFPNNYGLYADSCKIRTMVRKGGILSFTKDTVIRSFEFRDSVRVSFIPDSLKDYSVEVVIDPDYWNPNENRTNNFLHFDIPLKEYSFVQLKPVNNAVVSNDTINLVGINPLVDYSSTSVKVLLELDTSKSFSSPVKKTYSRSSVSGYVTKFSAALPVTLSNVFYYWRSNAVINGDSSGWTSPVSFSFDPDAYTGTSSRDVSENEFDFPDTGSVITHKKDDGQFSSGDLNNTSYSESGIKLNTSPLTLIVRSMGSSGAEASFFTVNYQNINIDGGRSPGLSMLKVRRLNGSILEYRNFRTTSGQSSDSVINFLNTFDSTHYLMALNASYVAGAVPLNASAKAKIRSFGSTKIDSFSVFGWFDSWSFIGYLGAQQTSVSERLRKYSGSAGWGEAVSSLNSTITGTSGTVSNFFGPSHSWKEFSWAQTLQPQSSIVFDVIGIDRNGNSILILQNQNTNQLVNISSINSYQYPMLNLLAKLNIDTLTGTTSPAFISLNTKYTPPAELIINKYSLVKSDTSFKPGEEMKLTFTCGNIGFVNASGIIARIYKNSLSPENFVSADTIYKGVKTDSSVTAVHKFKVPYVRPVGGKAKFFIEISPYGETNDMFSYNNTAEFSIGINTLQQAALFDVYSDGQIVRNGDYVQQRPEISIKLKKRAEGDGDNLKMNSELFKVFVNGAEVGANVKQKHDSEVADLDRNSPKPKEVSISGERLFKPELRSGENKLRIEFTDEQGVSYSDELTLLVGEESLARDLYNFPNPMKNETSFMFNVSGAEDPGKCFVKIFTSAGRLIKSITADARVGLNQIVWDGRDNDGDIVANGVYLYKLSFEGKSSNETATQKLVILR